MPHIILKGEIEPEQVVEEFLPKVHRWGRAVLKLAEAWLRKDRRALLVEGVVVELSRPLHPVILVGAQEGEVHIRLWPRVDVERTWPVQRLLAVYAAELVGYDSVEGPLSTNIPEQLWRDLPALATESQPQNPGCS
jgi:hypothetical protein